MRNRKLKAKNVCEETGNRKGEEKIEREDGVVTMSSACEKYSPRLLAAAEYAGPYRRRPEAPPLLRYSRAVATQGRFIAV